MLGDILAVVDVDLGEGDALGLAVLGAERFVGRRDRFTWSAPVRIDLICQRGFGRAERRNLQSVTTTEWEERVVLNCAEEVM